jgi:hypothetical protein|tara:strand:+ start:473 stop:781 length:309 start_codon:yes stop_codon:yes gene_type:complete
MKKLILILSIFFLLIFTTITKNSTKNIEKQIYDINENLRILEQKFEMVLLEFNYLSSPEKLMEYQAQYFENELEEIDITNLKKLSLFKKDFQIKQFINLKNE